jgi:hypothetical protein
MLPTTFPAREAAYQEPRSPIAAASFGAILDRRILRSTTESGRRAQVDGCKWTGTSGRVQVDGYKRVRRSKVHAAVESVGAPWR